MLSLVASVNSVNYTLYGSNHATLNEDRAILSATKIQPRDQYKGYVDILWRGPTSCCFKGQFLRDLLPVKHFNKKQTLWNCCGSTFAFRMSLLSPHQHCQGTERWRLAVTVLWISTLDMNVVYISNTCCYFKQEFGVGVTRWKINCLGWIYY